MATIRKEILTASDPNAVWEAIRDIGALHTRLVPGFVVDTKLAPGERIVTFANGMVVRELIVSLEEEEKRLVWSAISDRLTHHNASVQVFSGENGGTIDRGSRVVWIADILPNEAASAIDGMMEHGKNAMKSALDSLATNT
ncbi:MAG TPA: SRPBCC family protein [Candidatus Angelobacter sp.]|nr:SRPBCC family protein [Candidatus Angelobacter sp.]